MAWEMVVNNKDQRILIKAKMKVSIKTKKKVKFSNFKVTKDLQILIDYI
jgi:hypothetical protein